MKNASMNTIKVGGEQLNVSYYAGNSAGTINDDINTLNSQRSPLPGQKQSLQPKYQYSSFTNDRKRDLAGGVGGSSGGLDSNAGATEMVEGKKI